MKLEACLVISEAVLNHSPRPATPEIIKAVYDSYLFKVLWTVLYKSVYHKADQ